MDNVSVIIRNKNEERWIGHAIQSVVDFTNNPEIIIVDNNSTDDSRRIISTFDYLDIKTIKINEYTPGSSLNRGVELATSDTVLILSAHCVITHCNLNKIDELLKAHVAIWGKQIPIWNGKKINRRYVWSNFKNRDDVNYFCKEENRPFLHNALCFYNKQFLLENPFNEKLSGKEDRYWAIDRLEEGHNIYYDSSLIAHHHYTDNGSTWKGVG
tara:strand:- start:1007 stop:1645 length:639 start_codon:yes stop_codon:yes gene_type:complete